jgi:arylsulfatase A-like enzyme
MIASGLGRSGVVEDRFVSLLDLAPTFLDVAGVETPGEYGGRSLFELDDDADWRDHETAEFHGHKFAYEQRMVRRGSYKLVLNEFDTAEFYDLDADPNELTNRIGDSGYGDVIVDLYRQLVEDLEARGDPFIGPPTRKLSTTNVVDVDYSQP